MNPSPKELYNYLTKHYPGAEYYSVYEAGFSGFWADRQLRDLGIKNIIVNPADVPTKSKERRRKTLVKEIYNSSKKLIDKRSKFKKSIIGVIRDSGVASQSNSFGGKTIKEICSRRRRGKQDNNLT